MLSALLSEGITGLDSERLVVAKPSAILPQEVANHFVENPNRFTHIPSDIKISVRGTGINGAVIEIPQSQIPPAVQKAREGMMLAPTKEEWERDADEAKKTGREKIYRGFDGVRLIITDIIEENGMLVIEVAKASYSLRAATEKIATEIAKGERSRDDLLINDKVFQPNEFHAGALMFLSDHRQVAQIKGLADGSQEIHLNRQWRSRAAPFSG